MKKRNKNFRFTDDDIARMIELYNSGMSYTGVSRIYGVSKQRIHSLISKRVNELKRLEIQIRNKIDEFHRSYIKLSNGCWEWQGKISKAGYGRFYFLGQVQAHRASLIIHNIELPADKIVCHQCNNKKCVNPKHLFVGTIADNMVDRKRRYYVSELRCLERAIKLNRSTPKGTGDSLKDIAKSFNMSYITLSRISKSDYYPCIDGVCTFNWDK